MSVIYKPLSLWCLVKAATAPRHAPAEHDFQGGPREKSSTWPSLSHIRRAVQMRSLSDTGHGELGLPRGPGVPVARDKRLEADLEACAFCSFRILNRENRLPL